MSLKGLLSLLTQHIDDTFNIPYHWVYYITPVVVFVILGLLYYTFCVPLKRFHVLEDLGYPHLDKAKHRKRKTKSELVQESRRRRDVGDVPPVYPNGWFNILDSSDLQIGQVKHVQALGENFAVMRDSKGEVHVLDAYCPHLGANMAVGGVVRGDCLECPFHGWQFRGEDGTCAHIPYSDKVPKSARVKRWVSSEVNNLIHVWYHAEGEPPSWEVDRIPQIESGKWWFVGRSEYTLNCHVQDAFENGADFTHFTFVHRPGMVGGGGSGQSSSLMQHLWKGQVESNIVSGEEHCFRIAMHHTLELFGKFKMFPKSVYFKEVGPGVFLVNNNPVFTMVTSTPIEPLLIKWTQYFYSPLLVLPYAKLMMYITTKMGERDGIIWNNKKYLPKPILCKEEDSVLKHRRWFKQFYSPNSPRYPLHQDPLEW